MKIKHFAIFFLFTIIAILSWDYIWSQKEDLHNFPGRCGDCHLTEPEKGKRFIFTRDISFLCSECHEESKGLSHPVEVMPSMEVPSEFPLDWKGKMTCVTCHVAHKANSKTIRYLLRKNAFGELFCRSCHNISIEGMDLHKASLETAHVGSRYTEKSRLDYIDELSIKCLNCHEASIAGDVMIQPVGRGDFSHKPSIGLTHPIGTDYFDLSSEYMGAYVQPELLDERIRLFDGKVGCGTCHNPYSKKHFQLVMSNEGSKLCFACHRK